MYKLLIQLPEDTTIDSQSINKVVDQDLDHFCDDYLNKYPMSDPITKYERAIIKTYLMMKLGSQHGTR